MSRMETKLHRNDFLKNNKRRFNSLLVSLILRAEEKQTVDHEQAVTGAVYKTQIRVP